MTNKANTILSPSADSPTIMASPDLSSTASSVDGSNSPIFSKQSIDPTCSDPPTNYDKRDPTIFQQQPQFNSNNKRNFEYMNDDTSTMSHDDDNGSVDSEDFRGKKPGRKPMAEEEFDDDDEDPKIKRKAQNRAAQRAFRERKERYVKELEKKIKYVQDSHIYATTQLFQENQHLRSIIYRLELELGNFKGTPPGTLGNKSWLATVGPPPSINFFQPTPPHSQSYAPLQIRPSPIANKPRKIVPNLPEHKKQRQNCKSERDQQECEENKSTAAPTPSPSPSSPSPSITGTVATTANESTSTAQQFTFSITTPATLRASSDSELVRKNEQIQVVQLYPDHSHPANCLLESNKKQYQNSTTTPDLSPLTQYNPSSIASSVISSSSSSSDEEEKAAIIGADDQEFNDMLKPFLDTRGNFDFTTFNNNSQNQQDDTSSNTPTLILNQLLEEANSSNTNWSMTY